MVLKILNNVSQNSSQSSKRQIQAVIVGETRQVVRIFDLMKQPKVAVDELRKKITSVHYNGGTSAAVCAACHTPVYIAYAPSPGRQGMAPYFKHYGDGGKRCPWTTNRPDHPDAVRARQYEGRQKSPRHEMLLNAVASALKNDPRLDEVRVDLYHYPNHHKAGSGRFPDVYARLNDGREFAFEMQLSGTFMTEITQRREYYLKEGIALIWLFDGKRSEYDNQSFQDIIQDHSLDAFLFDESCVDVSSAAKGFRMKRTARRNGLFEPRDFAGLDDLKCLPGLLPFVEDGLSAEIISDARQRRAFLVDLHREYGPLRNASWLLDLSNILGSDVVSECAGEKINPGDILSLAAVVLTAARAARSDVTSGNEFKKFNYDSKDNSLAAVLNSWLSSKEHQRFSEPLAYAVKVLGLMNGLPESSKSVLLPPRQSEVDTEARGAEWRFLRWLFPEIFDEAVNDALRKRGTFLPKET